MPAANKHPAGAENSETAVRTPQSGPPQVGAA